MRASSETYKNVAENCSQFDPRMENETFSNQDGDFHTTSSCTICNHFTDSSYCNIDLFDQIVKSHNF